MNTTPKERSFWAQQIKDVLIIFVLSLPWAFFALNGLFTDAYEMSRVVIINFSIWLILWKGNAFVNYMVDIKYDWLKDPVKRLIASTIAHTVFTSGAITGIFYFYEWAFNIYLAGFKYTLLFSIVITFVISLVLHSISFLKSWRQVAIEGERMKKEVVSSKYETLKNQVNPHFLFNSLNALTNLVYEDQDQAAKFIKKLSDVYRYVLESRDKDLVELSTEMKFVDSYLFLQKIRYGNSLDSIVEMTDFSNYKIPPLSVQMLLENAIKHNVISQDEPLQVRIYKKEDYLMIVNNLQKKNIIKSESSEVGLSNIKARYAFFTDKPVIISDSDGKFSVGLPLLLQA